MLCKKEEVWKRVCESWYSVAPNVLEELYNAMPRWIANLIKAKRDATIYQLYDAGVHCYCVFIGMYLNYVVPLLTLLCFHWNVFDIYIQMLSDYTLIRFIETK